jgi:predicted transcriptional regulator
MIYVYLDINDSILLKSQDRSFHALYYIIKQMDLESNIWYSDKINKNHIAGSISCSLPALEKMIKSLRDRELLLSVSRGKYKLSEILKDY